ncbi:TPA: DUF551 domain-containing protein [Klebsiella pneumoniae]|nr:DUF551 domain-containing protein [Klebsiella pneumoniae]HDU8182814.1 DUF551 domain-containing protein [Klebsiella pneumoniae]
MALAAMDGEPVAWQYRVSAGPATGWILWHDGKGEQYENSYKVERRPLYCHAQPALVQPVMFIDGDISSEDADKLAKVIREFNEEDERPLAKMARIIRENPHPTNECDMPKAQPAPVVPDGYVMVPMRLTAENGAKGALSGEFSETKFVNCPECFGDDECETCDGSGRIEVTVPVTWTTIKEIWAKGVEHFAAAPQSPGSEPATVPGKWIPVSERMPELDTRVLLYFSDYSGHIEDGRIGDEGDGPYHYFFDGDSLSHEPTHWMQLPAGPQEVKGE